MAGAKALYSATLVLGILSILAAPGMPLYTLLGLTHGQVMRLFGVATAVVGAIGLSKVMMKKK